VTDRFTYLLLNAAKKIGFKILPKPNMLFGAKNTYASYLYHIYDIKLRQRPVHASAL